MGLIFRDGAPVVYDSGDYPKCCDGAGVLRLRWICGTSSDGPNARTLYWNWHCKCRQRHGARAIRRCDNQSHALRRVALKTGQHRKVRRITPPWHSFVPKESISRSIKSMSLPATQTPYHSVLEHSRVGSPSMPARRFDFATQTVHDKL